MLAEARSLGFDLADLLAAAEPHASMRTLTDWVTEVEPAFTPTTATTYRPYWRLAVDLYGDRRLSDLRLTELHAVVEAAAVRARRKPTRHHRQVLPGDLRRRAAGAVPTGL